MARGGSRGVKKPTLRDFTRAKPSKEDELRFRKAMDSPSDMVTAVVQAVELDYLLETTIRLHLSRSDDATAELLSKENGPISTFFAKIVLSYAMGTINEEEMEYLHTIRRIRNAFAHSRREISFSSDSVLSELSAIPTPKRGTKESRDRIELVRRLARDKIEIPEDPKRMEEIRSMTGRAAYVILCQEMAVLLAWAEVSLVSLRAGPTTKAGATTAEPDTADRKDDGVGMLRE